MRYVFRTSVILGLVTLLIGMLPVLATAAVFATTAFQQRWQMDESRIPNFWGPLSTAHYGMLEPYIGATSGPICPPEPGKACPGFIVNGQRTVQYFDKGRMEQTNPGAPVTSGLLATELVRGRIQMGDNQFDTRTPPSIPMAGDVDNTTPTFAQLATTASSLLAPAPSRLGSFVTVFINAQGQVEDGGGFAGISMTPPIGAYDDLTKHNVLGVFADYRSRAGLLVIGYAISEPFRANVRVGGQSRTVLVQVFERRVLTYTGSNPDPFKVEMGNIGLQYHAWRYGGGSSSSSGIAGDPASSRDTITRFFQTLQANGDVSQFFWPGAWDAVKNQLYDALGIASPIQSFVFNCEQDTQLQVGSPSARDANVTLTGSSGSRVVIVRMRITPGGFPISDFLYQTTGGVSFPPTCS